MVWGAYLQHYIIVKSLLKIHDDDHFHFYIDLQSEQRDALQQLNIPDNKETLKNWRRLRSDLRKASFEAWSRLPLKGRGVVIYREDLKADAWMSNRNGLTSSEWSNAIKMAE